jgi:hypothetical protein
MEATILITTWNSSTKTVSRRAKERYPNGTHGYTSNLNVLMKVVVPLPHFLNFLTLIYLIDLQNGERLKAPEVTAIAKKTWQEMSYDEQKAATISAVQDLQEVREMKTLAKRNVALSAFHDTKKTLESIENQVKDPHFHYFILFNNFV